MIKKRCSFVAVLLFSLLLAVSCASPKNAAAPAPISNSNTASDTSTLQVLSSKPAHFLATGPGQDAASQAIISWHCLTPTSTIIYADASAPDLSKSISLEGELTGSEWYDLDGIYRYKVILSDLTPATTYTYQIMTADGELSETFRFRTAGTDGTFGFAWLSDIHINLLANMKNVSDLIAYAEEKTDIAFCLFSGDMVNRGQTYRYWEYWTDSDILSDMEYAFVVGNHEYYTSKIKKISTDSFYLDFAPVYGSDYWFLYDNVLFICLDSIAPDVSEDDVLQRQASWFSQVVEENAGRFTYIIVAQHYAFLDGDIEGTGHYSFWYPIFDRYGVDLALSSDTHAYSRSKVLYNDAEAVFGTVYVTSPMTEGKEFSEFINDETSLGERSVFNTVKKVSGGCYISVTPNELTLHVLGKDGTEYDSVTIPAIR